MVEPEEAARGAVDAQTSPQRSLADGLRLWEQPEHLALREQGAFPCPCRAFPCHRCPSSAPCSPSSWPSSASGPCLTGHPAKTLALTGSWGAPHPPFASLPFASSPPLPPSVSSLPLFSWPPPPLLLLFSSCLPPLELDTRPPAPRRFSPFRGRRPSPASSSPRSVSQYHPAAQWAAVALAATAWWPAARAARAAVAGSMEADLARAVPAVPAVLPDGLWTTRGDPRVFDRDLVTCPPSGHRICPPTKGRPSGAAHHACPSPGDYGYGLSVFVPWASQ